MLLQDQVALITGANRGIGVIINPGWVDTGISREFDAAGDPEWSTPEKIARAALCLAAQAPRDITGQCLGIFGS